MISIWAGRATWSATSTPTSRVRSRSYGSSPWPYGGCSGRRSGRISLCTLICSLRKCLLVSVFPLLSLGWAVFESVRTLPLSEVTLGESFVAFAAITTVPIYSPNFSIEFTFDIIPLIKPLVGWIIVISFQIGHQSSTISLPYHSAFHPLTLVDHVTLCEGPLVGRSPLQIGGIEILELFWFESG